MLPIVRLILAIAALAIASPSFAQMAPKYPTKSVRVIVPYPPGGPTDVIGRLVAQQLTTQLGQSFYVENVSGASGVIGTVAAAKAAPDGSTILFTTNDFGVYPATTKDLAYDPVKSFAPVTVVATTPQIVVVHPSIPAKNLKELQALFKSDPQKYNYAAMGLGFGQLTGVRLFQIAFGLNATRVPFSGAAPMMNSTIAGHTPIAMIGMPPAAPLVKDGRLRAIAVTRRSPVLPDVSSFAEQGFPDQDADLIIGMVVPAGTPRAIVDILRNSTAKALSQPEVKSRLDALGFTAVVNTPEEYGARIKKDTEIWPKVAHEAGLDPQ